MTRNTGHKLFFILALLLVAGRAESFGVDGHRVIGEIAQQYLTASARTQVELLLEQESLAFASTWADEMRANPDHPRFWGYDYSANWHFVNVPENSSYLPAQASATGDAYTALVAFSVILQNQPVPQGPVRDGLALYFGGLENADYRQEVRRLALRFLVHIVQDLHQPLHVGHAEDQGGNRIQVSWFGDGSNLHTVWDTRLVGVQALGVTGLSRKLTQQIAALEPDEREAIQAADPLIWIQEGLSLREDVYAVEQYNSEFDYAYAAEYLPVVEQQLIKAGLRLAHMLNTIFSD